MCIRDSLHAAESGNLTAQGLLAFKYRDGLGAVSYTHLTLNPGEKYEVPVKDAYLLLTYLHPVSYTHLDVYKRQGIHKSEKRKAL